MQLDPDKADPHRAISGDLMRTRRRRFLPEASKRDYRAALHCVPNDAGAATCTSLTCSASDGRRPEAAASYGEALRLRPNDPGTLIDLGNVLRREGRFEEAVTCYREALRLQPDLAQAHNNLGITLRSLGRFV